MQPARPLRDVFDEVARGTLGADPAETLADSGHGDLPDQLVSEAIVSYADTAPVEVAEHLAPYVMVHSAVPTGAPAAADPAASDGLDLLASAPEPIVPDDPGDGAAEPDLPETAPAPAGDTDVLDFDFDFGSGSGAGEVSIDADQSIEDVGGVPVEPGPADGLAAPVEGAGASLAYPWIAPPEVEPGDDPEDGDPVG